MTVGVLKDIDAEDLVPGRTNLDPSVLHVGVNEAVDMVEGLRQDWFNLTYLQPEGGNRMRTTRMLSPRILAQNIWEYIARGNPSSIAVPLTNGAAREAFLNAFPDLEREEDGEIISRCRALSHDEIVAAGLLPVDDLGRMDRIKALFNSHREIYETVKKIWRCGATFRKLKSG